MGKASYLSFFPFLICLVYQGLCPSGFRSASEVLGRQGLPPALSLYRGRPGEATGTTESVSPTYKRDELKNINKLKTTKALITFCWMFWFPQ